MRKQRSEAIGVYAGRDNFVSQCLQAGGMPNDDGPLYWRCNRQTRQISRTFRYGGDFYTYGSKHQKVGPDMAGLLIKKWA
ncbi:amidase domain-containing protein [Bacillota bacterium Meth-B3]